VYEINGWKNNILLNTRRYVLLVVTLPLRSTKLHRYVNMPPSALCVMAFFSWQRSQKRFIPDIPVPCTTHNWRCHSVNRSRLRSKVKVTRHRIRKAHLRNAPKLTNNLEVCWANRTWPMVENDLVFVRYWWPFYFADLIKHYRGVSVTDWDVRTAAQTLIYLLTYLYIENQCSKGLRGEDQKSIIVL